MFGGKSHFIPEFMDDPTSAYIDEIHFLIKLKGSIGILNNRIHDKLALIAIERLKPRFPNVEFRYSGAGARGIDIRGFLNGQSVVACEVKTTFSSTSGALRGPQKRAIETDLKRLSAEDAPNRFLIVLSKETREVVESQLNPKANYPDIEIMDALGDQPLAVVAEEE